MIEPQNTELVKQKFFSDPDWRLVEEIILDYIEPLRDMDTVDTSQPAEHVKAEIIGRNLAYKALGKFLQDSKLVNRLRTEPTKSKFI